MPNDQYRRRKRDLSDHQKQMRFFTGLAILISSLLVLAFIWLLSRINYPVR
jgi:hypothetical protein